MVVENTPNVNEDEVLEWNFIRFLNRLQYLNHKAEAIEFQSTIDAASRDIR